MKHKIGFNKLNRTPAHRKALIRNQMTVLFKHERIVTTRAKAVETRRFAEKEITRAKVDSVHNRRMVARKIWDEEILAKLFTDIAPRFKERQGGYTRIIRLGERAHDAADMVVLELVERKDDGKQAERDKRKADKKAKAKAQAEADEKAAAEAEASAGAKA
jgi:large subunit ribosomal protein L17